MYLLHRICGVLERLRGAHRVLATEYDHTRGYHQRSQPCKHAELEPDGPERGQHGVLVGRGASCHPAVRQLLLPAPAWWRHAADRRRHRRQPRASIPHIRDLASADSLGRQRTRHPGQVAAVGNAPIGKRGHQIGKRGHHSFLRSGKGAITLFCGIVASTTGREVEKKSDGPFFPG